MSRLAIAIPSFNRSSMLDAVLHAYAPTCEELGVAIVVSDNASVDDTAEVCARWKARSPVFSFVRQPQTVPVGTNIMSAFRASPGEYSWFAGDDDFLLPERIRQVHALLTEESPSAVVVGTMEVPRPEYADLGRPLGEQLLPLVPTARPDESWTRHPDAAEFFAARHIKLPAPSVIYRTGATLETDFERYIPTHHPHIGALFDALAREQTNRGCVDVVELREVASISLTVHDARGKKNWSEIFHFLAVEGFPLWFSLLPSLYGPHLESARAFHRHIFRSAFEASERELPPVPEDDRARR